MKKILIGVLASSLMLGMTACGEIDDPLSENSGDIKNSMQTSEDSSANEDNSADISSDESGEGLYDENIDRALIEKINAMMNAAADNDFEAYLTAANSEEYISFISGSDLELSEINEEHRSGFDEICEMLGGEFSGNSVNLAVEPFVDDSYSENADAYGLSFLADGKDCRLNIWGTAYNFDGRWSVELSLWYTVDYAYEDFEPLIREQMDCAVKGDKDGYMKILNPDLMCDVFMAAWGEDESFSESELTESREMIEEMGESSFEDLQTALGEDFDGKILWLQQFEKAENELSEDVELYGRLLFTVKNSDGEYQEVEGYAYAYDGEKGVWLQPD